MTVCAVAVRSRRDNLISNAHHELSQPVSTGFAHRRELFRVQPRFLSVFFLLFMKVETHNSVFAAWERTRLVMRCEQLSLNEKKSYLYEYTCWTFMIILYGYNHVFAFWLYSHRRCLSVDGKQRNHCYSYGGQFITRNSLECNVLP